MSADAAKKGIRGAHASSTEDASDADLNVLEDGDGDADGDGRGDGRGDGGGGAAGYRHVGSTVRGK